MNKLDLTASQILAIPVDEPERLYSGDLDAAKREHRELSKKWHPQKATDDSSVAAWVHKLYAVAKQRIEAGTWQEKNLYRFTAIDGRTYELRYQKQRSFELGTVYVGERTLAYKVTKAAADLFERAERTINKFEFKSDRMREEMTRFLPRLKTTINAGEWLIMVLEKDPDVYCLRDVVDAYHKHLGPTLDSRHVAWMLSSIYNIGCYLHVSRMSHTDISLDTVFVSPSAHKGALLGGWWYATPYGEKLKAVTERTFKTLPSTLMKDKLAQKKLDPELIRATGRELLGDISGSKLKSDKSIPAPLLTWLTGVGGERAIDEYKTWQESVLPASYGKRKFVELKLGDAEIYGAT